MTQKEMVLNHLKEKGKITSMEAFRKYGVTRLSAVIFNLRDDGYDIETEYIKGKNRYREVTHYGEYKLIEKTN